MKKFILMFFILTSSTFADEVVIPTTYSTNGQVTSTNLNGNFQALAAKINGGLDNDNADTTSGYRFFETRSSLPSAGSQGRTIFLTTDNTLNFDTGSAYNKAMSVNSPSNGDIVYYNSGWNALTIGSSNKILSSNGSVPSWGFTVGTSASNIVQLDGSSRLPAVDGSQLTNITQANLSSILDYGTSTNSSTSKAQTSLKIAYGSQSIGASSSASITNLLYSSNTSYQCFVSQATNSTANENMVLTIDSASQITLYNKWPSGTLTLNWFCIGT